MTLPLICWYVSRDVLQCIENNQQMGRDVSSNVPTVRKILCDGEFLPFRDNMFDLVTSNLRSVNYSIFLLHDGLVV